MAESIHRSADFRKRWAGEMHGEAIPTGQRFRGYAGCNSDATTAGLRTARRFD